MRFSVPAQVIGFAILAFAASSPASSDDVIYEYSTYTGNACNSKISLYGNLKVDQCVDISGMGNAGSILFQNTTAYAVMLLSTVKHCGKQFDDFTGTECYILEGGPDILSFEAFDGF
jgi:hypothetical protein